MTSMVDEFDGGIDPYPRVKQLTWPSQLSLPAPIFQCVDPQAVYPSGACLARILLTVGLVEIQKSPRRST